MRRILLFLLFAIPLIVLADNPHNLPAAPVIVAQSDNVAQTAAIAPFVLFTPTASGDYRLSIYLEASAGTGTALCTTWNWTDDYATHSGPPFNTTGTNFFNIGISSTTPMSGGTVNVFHVVAGSPITVGIFDNPSGGCNIPPSYGAFWTLEKL